MDLPGPVKSTDARRGVSKDTPRRQFVLLALAAGLAGVVVVGIVRDRDTSRAITSSPSAGSTTRPIDATGPQPALLSAPTRDATRSNIEADNTADAALADFDRAFQAASEVELDLIAAARLPDIVRRDPRKTARFIELQPASKQRDVLVRHMSRLWGEIDAESALAWAQSLPDAQESKVARRGACLSLSQSNPAAAVERCAENDEDTEGEADFQGIFQAWAQSDPASASAWLAAQPASRRLDRLRQRYVQVLAKTNPREALRVSQEGFTVSADRDEAVLAVLHQWGLRDLPAARDWAGNHAPDDIRARALAEIDGLESYGASR